MSIDFAAIPQLVDSLGKPRLGVFKYYGQPGTGDAENNPKVPFVDKDFVTSAPAAQELDQFGQTSVQLYLNGLYSIAWWTGDATLIGSELIKRADFVGIDAAGGGGSDRVIDNVNDTRVQDEAGSLGAVFSATNDSSLQYINSLAFVWNATTRDIYRPNGTDIAMNISVTDVNMTHVGGAVSAFNANDTSTQIRNALNKLVFSTTDATGITLVDSLTSTNIFSDGNVSLLAGAITTLQGTTGVNVAASAGGIVLTANAGDIVLTNNAALGGISLTSGSSGDITINTGSSGFVSIGGGTSASLNALGTVTASSFTGDINLTSTAANINLLCSAASGIINLTAGVTGSTNITGGSNLNATGTDITITGNTTVDVISSFGQATIRGASTLVKSETNVTYDTNLTTGQHIFKLGGTNRLVIEAAFPFFSYTSEFLFNSSTSNVAISALAIRKNTTSTNNDIFVLMDRGGDSASIRMDAAGALFFSPAASDIRLKSEYTELTDTLDKIVKVPVYNGKMRLANDPSTKIQRTYFIADKLKEQFPELVDVDGVEGIDDDGNKTTFLAVKRDMNEILWSGLRDAKMQIDQLRSELELLKNA